MEEKHRCQRQIEASQLKHQLQWLECERYQYFVKLLGDNDLLLQCCCQLLILYGCGPSYYYLVQAYCQALLRTLFHHI